MSKTQQRLFGCLIIAIMVIIFTIAFHTIFERNTPGIDYFVYWNAAKALYNGQNPYSPQLARQIQIGIYGHPAMPEQDPMPFAYPPYSLFVLLPIFWMDFAWSQAAWFTINFFLILLCAFLIFPHSPLWLRLTFVFFYPFVFGLILGNFVIAIAAVLIIFLRIFLDSHSPSVPLQLLIGGLLSWTTIKPQFVWAFFFLFFVYGIRRRLWPMLASFFAITTGLLLVSLILQPAWIKDWIGQLGAYQTANQAMPYITKFLSSYFKPTQYISVSAITFVICGGITLFLVYRWWKSNLDPLALVIWLGFISYLVHPGFVAYEQIIFLIPFFLWAVSTKPSIHLAMFWIAVWLLSFLKIPAWFEQAYFLFYIAWMAWFFVKTAQTRTRAVPNSD